MADAVPRKSQKRRIDVMVSSTTNDLGEHRQRLSPIITNLLLTPRMMDNDSATGKDGLTYSLDLVDEAEIYILLLGFRYGYVPDDPRNPEKLSMTHLEYRRAKERQKRDGICVLAFLLEDALKPEIVRPELTAFRNEVLGDQVKFFKTADELLLLVQQALSQSPCVREDEDAPAEPDFQPRVGEVLAGRYTFERELGSGGNGSVWRARERLLDGSQLFVAVKLLKQEISNDPRRIERFKKEIALTRRLRHPHIIRTTTDGMFGSQFYAVMDYIEGQPLREFIQGRKFSVDETVRYLGQVAEALHAAHRQNVIHRDVKPENIMVTGEQLFLGDFGLAISPEEDEHITATGELVGTKKYMAPEQWDNQTATPQTDIYALGFIAYEMLTGEYPFDDSSHARLLTQHMHHELPEYPGLAPEILAILRRATAKTPSARHPSAIDFVTSLEHWTADPDNLETKISQYMGNLRRGLKGDVYEKLFVDLEGDIRQVIHQVREKTQPDERYHDPQMDDFADLMDNLLVDLDADHHEPQAPQAEHVEKIMDQLVECDRVVLVGEPGSGKSFTLRRLVMRYIHEYDQHQRVPVFVPLNAFKGETSFIEYIQAQMGELSPYYGELLRRKRLVLICDALNEMPRSASDGRDLVAEVREELTKVPHFVVSCRVRDYKNDLDSLGLERLEVRDLELPAIREFVRRYRLLLKYDDDELWQKMGGSEDLFLFWREVNEKGEPERFWREDGGIPGYTTMSGDNAWQQMWQGAKLIPLARNPYLARVICGLHGRDQMPANRAELYRAFVTDLYEREQKHAVARGQSFPERDALERYLTDLASRMQEGQTTVLKVETVPQGDLLQAGLDATILTQDGDDLRFSHQLLQEYFAARILLEKMLNDDDPIPVFGESWWNVSVWRETANMLIDFSKEPLRVLRWIAPATLPLALEILERYELTLDEPTQEVLLQEAQQHSTDDNPVRRNEAYRVLALLNADTRPHISVKDGLPDIDWSEMIPPGEYPIGGDEKARSPLPAQRYKLERSFQISQYPITNAQFEAFLTAEDGYRSTERDWFEGLAADESDRQIRENPRFHYGNHPRVDVNWYQAMAFCRWLSWKLGGGYDLDKINEWVVRLPTEKEWEIAARGPEGLFYPYGNEFDATKGNTDETGIKQTSAVGIFPDGASPYGVQDMSGNVWEWCLTDYSNPAEHPEAEDLRSSSSRVLRGGSWYYNRHLARAASRYGYGPGYWYLRLGVRVVFCPIR